MDGRVGASERVLVPGSPSLTSFFPSFFLCNIPLRFCFFAFFRIATHFSVFLACMAF